MGRPKGSKNKKSEVETSKECNSAMETELVLDDSLFDKATQYQALCILRDHFAAQGVCGIWKKIHKDLLAHPATKEGIHEVKRIWLEKVFRIIH